MKVQDHRSSYKGINIILVRLLIALQSLIEEGFYRKLTNDKVTIIPQSVPTT